MQENVVFKFEVFDERIKQEAMKVVVEFQGITSIKWIEKDALEVIGEFDKFEMLKKVRKIDEDVEIFMFGPNGKVIEPEVTEPSEVELPPHQRSDKRPIDNTKPADNAGSSNWYGLDTVFNKENANKVIDLGARVGGQINRENMNKAIDLGARVGGYLYNQDAKKQEGNKHNNGEKQKNQPPVWKKQQEPNFLAQNKGWWPFGQDKKQEKKIILDNNNGKNKEKPNLLGQNKGWWPLGQDKKEEKRIIQDKNNGKNKEKPNLVQKQRRLPPLGPDKNVEKKKIPGKNNKQSNGASSSKTLAEKTESQRGYTDFWRTAQSTMPTFLGGETTQDQRSTQAPKTITQSVSEQRRTGDSLKTYNRYSSLNPK